MSRNQFEALLDQVEGVAGLRSVVMADVAPKEGAEHAEADPEAAELLRRLDAIAQPDEPPRSYIGASVIGDPCKVRLALELRGFPSNRPSARARRIFRDGHRIEAQVIEDLRASGAKVEEVDPATGKQWHFSTYGGHVSGSLDGKLNGAVLEVKSINDKRFSALLRQGVAKSNPKYAAQMQTCMGLSGINEAMFIAYNKNTGVYYTELVRFEPSEFLSLLGRASEAMFDPALKRAGHHRDAWPCSLCPKSEACWQDPRSIGVTDCRKCAHSAPDPTTGGWFCKHLQQPAVGVCSSFIPFHPRPKRGL